MEISMENSMDPKPNSQIDLINKMAARFHAKGKRNTAITAGSDDSYRRAAKAAKAAGGFARKRQSNINLAAATESEARKQADVERKAQEEQMRIRHVEGLRQQMQDAGIDTTRTTTGISRLNPEVFNRSLTSSSGVTTKRVLSNPILSMLGIQNKRYSTKVKRPLSLSSMISKIFSAGTRVRNAMGIEANPKKDVEFGMLKPPSRRRQR